MSKGHFDNAAFLAAVERCIPSEFNLITGNDDDDEAQESFVASRKFQLPNALGAEGGVATSSFLHLLYENKDTVCRGIKGKSGSELTCQELLRKMHQSMKDAGFDSVPQFSSSRPLDKPRSFHVVPPGFSGRRRALLIGVNFMGQKGQLRAPHNDCHNVEQFLLAIGFKPEDMIVLVDDGKHAPPTRKNIEDGFAKITKAARARDAVFVSYSGHGGRVVDKTGREKDGYNSSIFPVDFATAGQIIDDDILKNLIKAMPPGVHTTMVVDCCHSGSVGDLPYRLPANAKTQVIEHDFDTDTREEIIAKDNAANQAEEDRKKAKAQRKAEREALRKEKREAAEKAAAAPSIATQPQVFMQTPQMVMPSGMSFRPQAMNMPAAAPPTTHTFDASSEEEAKRLAAQFGASLAISPQQKQVMANGGKITCTVTSTPVSTMHTQPMMMMSPGQPIMMTPEQAAIFAKQQAGSGVQVMMGSPMMMSPQQAAAFAKQQGGNNVQYMTK